MGPKLARMIPVINATRDVQLKAHIKSVLRLERRPLALSLVEHELSVGDPAVARKLVTALIAASQFIAAFSNR